MKSYSSCPISQTSKINGGTLAGIVTGAVVLIIVLLAIWKLKGNKGQKHGPITDFNPVDPSPELSPTTCADLLIVEPSTPPLSNNSANLSRQQSKQSTDHDFWIDKNCHPLPPPPISTLNEENRIKTPPPLPLPSPPPLPNPPVPSQ